MLLIIVYTARNIAYSLKCVNVMCIWVNLCFTGLLSYFMYRRILLLFAIDGGYILGRWVCHILRVCAF